MTQISRHNTTLIKSIKQQYQRLLTQSFHRNLIIIALQSHPLFHPADSTLREIRVQHVEQNTLELYRAQRVCHKGMWSMSGMLVSIYISVHALFGV